MNISNPDFLAHSREAFRANKPSTLAELRSRVEADRTLDKTKRRDLLSALKRLLTWFGRPLAAITATPTATLSFSPEPRPQSSTWRPRHWRTFARSLARW